jgi:hypothetical protein
MKIHSEKGLALPLVMIAVMVGALVIPAFLGRVSTGLIGTRNYRDVMDAQYAADAGAEHAIWNLTNGTVADLIPQPGDSTSYNLAEPVNGLVTNIKISNAWDVIAWDNFNDGTWTGGGGWIDEWTSSGDALVTTTGTPYEGDYHLRLRDSNGVVSRAVNLGQQVSAYLVFRAKVDSFEPGDSVICRVSPDGTTWTTIYTWDDTASDGIYHYYNLDLNSYGLTDVFYISFKSAMDSSSDYFYVDDLKIVWPAATGEIKAVDDFESGGWNGGSGWLGDWVNNGFSGVVTSGIPHGGSNHLLLQDTDGYVTRPVDLSGSSAAHLKFWAVVDAFEDNDYSYCLVSSDNVTWNTVYTWGNTNDDSTYHYYDIDLSGYDLTGQFWIAFSAGMNSADDYFYVDDVSIDAVRAYCITVTSGNRILKAAVDLMDGTPQILCWWFIV